MFKLNLSKAIVNGECGTNKPDKFLSCNLEVKQKGSIIENPEGMINEVKVDIESERSKAEKVRKGFFLFGGRPPSSGGKPDTPIIFGQNNHKYMLGGFNMLQMSLPAPFYFLNGTPVHFEIIMLAVTEDMGGNPPHMSNMLSLRVPILPSTDKTPATQQIEKMINGIVRASPEVPGSVKLGISIDISLFFTGGASYYAMKSKEQTAFTKVIVGTDGSIPLSNEYFVKFFKLFMRNSPLLTADGKLPPNMNTWPKIERLIAKDPVSKISVERKTGEKFDTYEQIYINNEGINNGGNEKGSREVDERGKKTVSSKGNTYNVDYSAGDVYIDCQPVNIDEEQTNVKMEGYKLQSEMDIIPTKEKIMEYLMNPWVQGFILFLVILILFMVVKMLMAKGKTQGKADLDTGS
tara:strand:- start:1681 stop:2898 length:1218 start_codon:yes stop_codon:yes gene_type:complete